MRDLFPRAGFMRTGYHLVQVDEFFDRARAAYERPMLDDGGLSALDVRRAAFDITRGGYQTAPVDAALDRLEIAFATRAREQYVRAHGHDAWMNQLAERAQVLYPRLRRPRGQRFRPPVKSREGYDASEVDALMERLIAFFDTGESLTPEDIRHATFTRRGKRGAYDERTVDAFLARAVDILMGAQ
ncbi:DivIVA domain-containing protein [Demequina sp.]|uniref:DivIVA domain-containing protein n=1 Tax=Demequina sp. TaxID=2050685 RepID=UPI0025C26BCA|nr:DivIVA domain-containing protein [Demequina sp.]